MTLTSQFNGSTPLVLDGFIRRRRDLVEVCGGPLPYEKITTLADLTKEMLIKRWSLTTKRNETKRNGRFFFPTGEKFFEKGVFQQQNTCCFFAILFLGRGSFIMGPTRFYWGPGGSKVDAKMLRNKSEF